MTMEDNCALPPIMRQDCNGMWYPIYSPTEEDWKLYNEARKRNYNEVRNASAMIWHQCVEEILMDSKTV